MTRHKGIPSNAQIDRDFPHQVAVHADLVRGFRYAGVATAGAGLEQARKTRVLIMTRPDRWQQPYLAYCFRHRDDAQTFIDRLGGGEHFDPAWRKPGKDGSGAWARPDMGDRQERLPEILGRLEQALGGDPTLERDIAWLLSVEPVRFTRYRDEVETFLRAALPEGRWEVTTGPRIDAGIQAGLDAPWFNAWQPGNHFIDSEPVALTLAYMRLWVASAGPTASFP